MEITDLQLKVIRAALEVSWTHVSRSIEIMEQDDPQDEDLQDARDQLTVIEAAQEIAGRIR